MPPIRTNRGDKKWIAKELQNRFPDFPDAAKFVETLEDETDAPQRLAARDLKFTRVVEIFGLKKKQTWDLQKEDYDVPAYLTFVLGLPDRVPLDENSEAYSRYAITNMIMACVIKLRKNLSKQSQKSTNDPTSATFPTLEPSGLPINSPHDQITSTTPSKAPESTSQPTNDSYDQIAPTTPSKTSESTSQPLPIKVFPEMFLSVEVREKGGKKWLINGIADWAMGYGTREALEDGTVMLAVEAKRQDSFSNAEGQLLAYLAIIRQLRIQANKENVMTQGFYSDGKRYTFMCIRNDGTVMRSDVYDTSFKRNVKPVFNFLLNMLTTAANSSPNTSPIKAGKERDEKMKNLDWDVFVRVVEDTNNDMEEDEVGEDEVGEDECRLWMKEVV